MAALVASEALLQQLGGAMPTAPNATAMAVVGGSGTGAPPPNGEFALPAQDDHAGTCAVDLLGVANTVLKRKATLDDQNRELRSKKAELQKSMVQHGRTAVRVDGEIAFLQKTTRRAALNADTIAAGLRKVWDLPEEDLNDVLDKIDLARKEMSQQKITLKFLRRGSAAYQKALAQGQLPVMDRATATNGGLAKKRKRPTS